MLRRRRPRLTRQEVLDSRPVRNQALRAERTPEGEAAVIIPRRTDLMGRVLAALFVVPREKRLVLDSVGSEVWELCDGQHNIRQIIEALQAKHNLTRREAEVSLMDYLRQLGRRGLVGFAIMRPEQKDGAHGRDRRTG